MSLTHIQVSSETSGGGASRAQLRSRRSNMVEVGMVTCELRSIAAQVATATDCTSVSDELLMARAAERLRVQPVVKLNGNVCFVPNLDTAYQRAGVIRPALLSAPDQFNTLQHSGRQTKWLRALGILGKDSWKPAGRTWEVC